MNCFDRYPPFSWLPKPRRLLKSDFSAGLVKVYYMKPTRQGDLTKVSCRYPRQKSNPVFLPGDVPTVDDLMKATMDFPDHTVLVCDEREA